MTRKKNVWKFSKQNVYIRLVFLSAFSLPSMVVSPGFRLGYENDVIQITSRQVRNNVYFNTLVENTFDRNHIKNQ